MISHRQLAWDSLRRAPRRTAFTLLAIIISVGLMTGTGLIRSSVQAQVLRNAVATHGAHHARFPAVAPGMAETILSAPEIESGGLIWPARPGTVRRGNGDVAEGAPTTPVTLHTVSAGALQLLEPTFQVIDGRLPQQPDEIAVSPATAEFLRVAAPFVEGRVSVDTGDTRTREATVVGVFRPLVSDVAVRGGDVLQIRSVSSLQPNDTDAEEGTLLVRFNDARDAVRHGMEIAGRFGLPEDKVVFNERILSYSGASSHENINRSFFLFQVIVISVIAGAMVITIANAFTLSLNDRVEEVGILRCIGATPRFVLRQVVGEAGILAVIGIPLGLSGGIGAIAALFALLTRITDHGILGRLDVVVTPAVFVGSIGAALFAVAVSVSIPAVRACGVPPISAARGTILQPRHPRHRRIARRGPSVLSLSRPRRDGVPILGIALHNLGQDRRQAVAVILSLAISIILVVAFGGMLRLAREANVVPDPGLPEISLRNPAGIEKSVLETVPTFPSVSAVYPYAEIPITVNVSVGDLTDAYRRYVPGFSAEEIMSEKIDLPARLITYAGQRYGNAGSSGSARPHAILVGRSAFTDGPGRTVYAVPFQNHNPVPGGIDIVVDEPLFRWISDGREIDTALVAIEAGGDTHDLDAYLRALVDRRSGYSYSDARLLSQRYTQDFRALSLFFYGFIVTVSIIGAANVVNTVAARVQVRRQEMNVLRAMGVDDRSFVASVVLEVLIMAAIALLIGAGAGTGLWWILVHVVGMVRSTTFSVPFQEILVSAVGLLVIAIPAGYEASRRALNASIADELRRLHR
ncbi:MAG: ABC transporter permease [Spirochaeta sp.]|nr:ABC transporter permease [Spirochaeta sp.]